MKRNSATPTNNQPCCLVFAHNQEDLFDNVLPCPSNAKSYYLGSSTLFDQWKHNSPQTLGTTRLKRKGHQTRRPESEKNISPNSGFFSAESFRVVHPKAFLGFGSRYQGVDTCPGKKQAPGPREKENKSQGRRKGSKDVPLKPKAKAEGRKHQVKGTP